MRSINIQVKESKLLIFTIILLILNTILLTLGINFIKAEGGSSPDNLDIKKQFALELVDYNERLAQKLEIDNRTEVRETLSRFHYEITLATSTDELFKTILSDGRGVQETIIREYENYQQDIVLAVVNQDPKINNTVSRKSMKIDFDDEEGVIIDPEDMIEDTTREKISELAFQQDFTPRQRLELEIEEGQAKVAVPFNPLEHIQSLTREIDSLRASLYEVRVEAGHEELTGPGVLINIYDADDGHTEDTIVHDSDIRDIVNELFTIGAEGIAVGDQRLTTTSSIRCVGPTIRVNDESIPVNPVVIKAVGNPEALASGLDIFTIIFDMHGGLRLEIEKVDKLTLPSYSG